MKVAAFLLRASEPGASGQGSGPNQDRDKNFRFLPTMHLDLTKMLCTPVAFILLRSSAVVLLVLFCGNSSRLVKFLSCYVSVMNFSIMSCCHGAFTFIW